MNYFKYLPFVRADGVSAMHKVCLRPANGGDRRQRCVFCALACFAAMRWRRRRRRPLQCVAPGDNRSKTLALTTFPKQFERVAHSSAKSHSFPGIRSTLVGPGTDSDEFRGKRTFRARSADASFLLAPSPSAANRNLSF